MTCIQTQPLLDAYADGELSRLAAFRVRRHLTLCAACAAQLADIQRLGASVRAWHDVPAPAGLEGRLAAQLPPSVSVSMPPRDRRVARRAAVGLAGAAAAVGMGFWLLPGHPSQPTLALADVEQAMEQVETLSWVTTAHNSFIDRTGHKTETVVAELSWLRRKPAAISTIEQAKSYPKGLRSLSDSRGEIFQYSNNAYRTYKPNSTNDIAKAVEREIRRMTQLPTQNAAPNLNGTIRRRLSPLQEHETTLNGHVQILFVRKADLVVTTNPVPQQLIHVSESMWVEPTTHRVTQVEVQNVGGVRGSDARASLTYNNFHYNQAPSPGTFDWSPPPGAKVERH